MPELESTDARRLDAAAVDTILRRLARENAPPWLHGEVARRMAERLAVIRLQPEHIVDWWSFLGASGPLLDKAYPKARRIAIEPTAALAERNRRASRVPWWSPRRLHGAAVDVKLEHDAMLPAAQMIWANMMLHAVKDPPALMNRWQRTLAADGFVMFSCFGPDTVRELRELYARLGWPSPTVEFVDMHDLGDMLVRSGFADPVMDQETLTLSWSSPQAMLAELRGLGGNASPDRLAGLRTPRWRVKLEHELQALRSADGRLQLRFEIAYGHAFKALPRARPDEPTSVSLEEMRSLVRAWRSRL